MIIFGVTEILLNFYEPGTIECPECSKQNLTYRVVQRYFHVYGLPCYPVQKYTGMNCADCGLANNDVTSEMSAILEKESRTPFYTYTGVAILSLICVLILAVIFI
jgi:ssDNA-binding Zn-finger/Zn-ribbon topoisomerase 1